MLEDLVEQMKALYELMASDELASSIAKMYRNIYNHLKKEGFDSDEALELLSRMNLGKN